MVRWSVIGAVVFFSASIRAQDPIEVIQIYNSSFEDFARCCQPPTGWMDCGFQGETPPDVQPAGGFSVNRPAQDGRTYMGMVTRENDTWESVQQKLEHPLEKNSCYSFSIHLCRSAVYMSGTKTSQELESFTKPIKLRIWGGSGACTKRELLGESELISNTEWKKFDFKFEPNSTVSYIILEAFYKTPTLLPYNGNILIDNASDIVLIPCKEEQNIAKVSADTRTNTPKPPIKNKPQPREPVIVEKTPSKVLNLDRKNVRKGQSIIIQSLYFESDSTVIPTDCYAVLDELHEFLNVNKDIIIEISGHTNGIPKDDYCDRLSLARAKAVATYIAGKGIPWRRLYYRGYGKKKLIANDATIEGRKKNQRVEFKILHMNS